jgi:ubiquinone/menaquinone biosynthesis C-methylase UbiE
LSVQASVEQEAIIETLKRLKFSTALDIGCGNGRYLAFVARHSKVVGLDISSKMARAAKQKARESDIVVADMEFIPFQDDAFDLLYSIRVMKYLKNQARFLGEARRTCKEGGCVLLCDERMSENISYLVLQICLRIQRIFESCRSQQARPRRMRPSAIVGLLEQSGMPNVHARGVLFFPSEIYARMPRVFLRALTIVDKLLSRFPASRYLASVVLFVAIKG